MESHECEFGPFDYSRIGGAYCRRCTVPGCRAVSLDEDDGDGPESVPAASLRTGDVITKDGHEWTVTARRIESGEFAGLVLVTGRTADNRGWFRHLVPSSREYDRVTR